MEQPEDFIVKGQERKVCQLRKAIYGLKQAALQWNKQLHKSLLEMGFTCCIADPGTYYKITGDTIIILLIYVDDALFMDSNKGQLLDHKKKFMKWWESCDLDEAKEYLGIRLTRDYKAHMITLDQTHYAKKVAKCYVSLYLSTSLVSDIFLLINDSSFITNCPLSLHNYSPISSSWLLPHSLSSWVHHLMTRSCLLCFILLSSITFYLVTQLDIPEPTLNQGVKYIRPLDEDLHP